MASGYSHSLYTGMANTGSQYKSQTSVYCDFCESKGMWRCLDCECRPVMCDKCKDNIHSKMAKNHRMERIKEVPYKDVSGSLKFRNIKCEEHEGMSCSHYCKACSKIICSQCITQTKTHNRHHILVHEDDFDDKKAKFEKAQRNIIRWSKGSDRMKGEKKKINEKFEKVKQDIFDHKKSWHSMIDKYADELSKDLKKRQKLILIDIDIEHNEIEETLEKLQTACDTLGSKPCTTSEGVIFFLENFDSLSDSLTEEIPNENYMPSRDILYPHFVPGDFSLLTFGSLEVDTFRTLKLEAIEYRVGYKH